MKASWKTNFLLKASALALALVVWYGYRIEQLAIRFVTVPLQFQNLPADRVLSGDVPESITVQLEAPEAMARGLSPDRIDARLDLAGVVLGPQEVRLDPEDIRIPAGVRVISIEPTAVPLTVERKARRTLPVEARVRGEAGSGFRIAEVRLLPTTVTVEGPESEVGRTEKARTDWVDVRGQTATFQEGVAVVPDNTRVRIVGARSAIVTVEIEPAAGEEG
jgi:YbbR domain-containing protein